MCSCCCSALRHPEAKQSIPEAEAGQPDTKEDQYRLLCETRTPPPVASPPTPRASTPAARENCTTRVLCQLGAALEHGQKPQALRHFGIAPTSLSEFHSCLQSWGTPICLHNAVLRMPTCFPCLAGPICCVVCEVHDIYRFLDPAETIANEEVHDRLLYQHIQKCRIQLLAQTALEGYQKQPGRETLDGLQLVFGLVNLEHEAHA